MAKGKNAYFKWSVVHVFQHDRETYAGATDGHRLHAIKVDIQPGVYSLDGETLTLVTGEKPIDIGIIIPRIFDVERTLVQPDKKELDAKADEHNRVQLEHAWFDYRYILDATSYAKVGQLYMQHPHRPAMIQYDGAFAVIMPMLSN